MLAGVVFGPHPCLNYYRNLLVNLCDSAGAVSLARPERQMHRLE